jgi:multiple sugar transport system permease protein
MRRWVKKNIKHYLMLLPFFSMFSIFILYPIIWGFYISFNKWDSVHPPTFVGLDNYINVISSSGFTKAFTNLFKYVALTIPVNIIVAFGLAILVNSFKGRLSNYFRSAYFLPTMVPIFLAASIWRWLYAPDVGFINTILGRFGIAQIGWLTDPKVMLVSLVIVDVWLSAGFNMIILLAGIKNIPDVYYDAAKVDGANGLQEIIYITIPLLEPILFLVIVYSFISALQVFDAPWLLTTSSYTAYGGRSQALLFPVMDLMGRAFSGLRFGLAAAYGFILTILILLWTIVQFAIRRRTQDRV